MYKSIIGVFSTSVRDLNIVQNKLESIASDLRSEGYSVNVDIFEIPDIFLNSND